MPNTHALCLYNSPACLSNLKIEFVLINVVMIAVWTISATASRLILTIWHQFGESTQVPEVHSRPWARP